MTPTAESQTAPMPSRWIALGGLWLVYAAFGATAASLAPLLPEIRAFYRTTDSMMGAVLGAWPLVYIAAAIPAGAVLDRIGARLGLFIATLVVALSAALRAAADTPVDLMLAVAVFGIGGPLISVGAPKLITELFTGPARGTAMGIYMTGPNIGAIFALSTTSTLLLPLGGTWQGVMLIHAGIALASGLIWLAVSAIAGVTAAAPSQERFRMGALRDMLTNGSVVIVLILAVGIFFINHALNNWLPSILRDTGMAADAAGVWAAVPTLVGILAALTLPRFATGARKIPMLVGLSLLACLCGLMLAAGPGNGMFTALVLQGLVRGALMTVAMLVLVDLPSVPPTRIGLAGGAFFAAGEIGGVLGPLTFGVMRDATGSFALPLGFLAAVAATIAALGLLLARRRGA